MENPDSLCSVLPVFLALTQPMDSQIPSLCFPGVLGKPRNAQFDHKSGSDPAAIPKMSWEEPAPRVSAFQGGESLSRPWICSPSGGTRSDFPWGGFKSSASSSWEDKSRLDGADPVGIVLSHGRDLDQNGL